MLRNFTYCATMDAKYLEVVIRKLHATKQWSPDEIRVWQQQTLELRNVGNDTRYLNMKILQFKRGKLWARWDIFSPNENYNFYLNTNMISYNKRLYFFYTMRETLENSSFFFSWIGWWNSSNGLIFIAKDFRLRIECSLQNFHPPTNLQV